MALFSLTQLDIFGKQYKFNIKGNDSVKTKVGGAMTLLFYMALFAFFVMSLLDLHNKKAIRTVLEFS